MTDPWKLPASDRRRHCDAKVRHASRNAAAATLAAILPKGRIEALEPYPCKFCSGWHNGHPPRERLFAFEPRCGCAHWAITHESGPGGLGCYECDCLRPREHVYRSVIAHERALTRDAARRHARLGRLFTGLLARLPLALKPWLRSTLSMLAQRPDAGASERR